MGNKLSSAAAIGTGEDFEQVAVRILKVKATAAVSRVELAGMALPWIGPVGEMAFLDAMPDPIELALADEECIVLRVDFAGRIDVVERHLVVELYADKRPEGHGSRQFEEVRKKCSRGSLVMRCDDGVVELDCHLDTIPMLRECAKICGSARARIR